MKTVNRRPYFSSQFIAVWIGDRYFALVGPKHRPYFSERNRIKCRVVPLLGGWRTVIRKSS